MGTRRRQRSGVRVPRAAVRRGGPCVGVPAHPNAKIPAASDAAHLSRGRAYGLVWTCLRPDADGGPRRRSRSLPGWGDDGLPERDLPARSTSRRSPAGRSRASSTSRTSPSSTSTPSVTRQHRWCRSTTRSTTENGFTVDYWSTVGNYPHGGKIGEPGFQWLRHFEAHLPFTATLIVHFPGRRAAVHHERRVAGLGPANPDVRADREELRHRPAGPGDLRLQPADLRGGPRDRGGPEAGEPAARPAHRGQHRRRSQLGGVPARAARAGPEPLLHGLSAAGADREMDTSSRDVVRCPLPDWVLRRDRRVTGLRCLRSHDRMRLVHRLADRNHREGTGGPFAALVANADTGEILSVGVNLVLATNLSSVHAEVVAICLAQARLGTWDLGGTGRPATELVVNWRPCVMCYGADDVVRRRTPGDRRRGRRGRGADRLRRGPDARGLEGTVRRARHRGRHRCAARRGAGHLPRVRRTDRHHRLQWTPARTRVASGRAVPAATAQGRSGKPEPTATGRHAHDGSVGSTPGRSWRRCRPASSTVAAAGAGFRRPRRRLARRARSRSGRASRDDHLSEGAVPAGATHDLGHRLLRGCGVVSFVD